MTSSNGNIFRVIGHLWIQRSPMISPKGQRRGALMFSLICVWINGWVNTREAGDLRRYRAHYDVTVMDTLPDFSGRKAVSRKCFPRILLVFIRNFHHLSAGIVRSHIIRLELEDYAYTHIYTCIISVWQKSPTMNKEYYKPLTKVTIVMMLLILDVCLWQFWFLKSPTHRDWWLEYLSLNVVLTSVRIADIVET